MNSTPQSACPVESELKALVDGELTGAARQSVERHLAECPACTQLRDALHLLTSEVGLMSDRTPCPDAVRERVLAALPAHRPRFPRLNRFSLLRFSSGAALAAVCLFVVSAIAGPSFLSGLIGKPLDLLKRMSANYTQDYDEVAKAGRFPMGVAAGGSAAAPPPASPSAASGGMPMLEAQSSDGHAKAAGTGHLGQSYNGDPYSGAISRAQTPNVSAPASDVEKYVHGNTMDEVLRKVVKSATLGLEVKERLETLQDRISKKVKADEGYVESMNLSAPAEGAGKRTSRMALRVQVALFEPTIEYLSKLGEVTAKEMGGKDITGTWLEQRADVRTLRTKEEKYATAFRSAKTRTAREQARQQLLNLRPVLQASEEQFAATAKLAALARIDLTLTEEPQARVRGDIGKDLQNQMKAAGAAFMVALRIPATLLIWLAVFAPLWLPCLLAYRWATRMAQRREASAGETA